MYIHQKNLSANPQHQLCVLQYIYSSYIAWPTIKLYGKQQYFQRYSSLLCIFQAAKSKKKKNKSSQVVSSYLFHTNSTNWRESGTDNKNAISTIMAASIKYTVVLYETAHTKNTQRKSFAPQQQRKGSSLSLLEKGQKNNFVVK